MALTFRAAELGDIPAMAELPAQTKGDQAFWTERLSKYLRGEHLPQMALARACFFVATDEGKIVGFVAGHMTHRHDCDGEVQGIDVDDKQRGLGIGYHLVSGQGAKRICINVGANSLRARQLYKKSGAQPLSDAWMIWEHASLLCARRGG